MKCAALHTFTMCAHLPRGLQVQIPIAGILTCWCTCSLACPLHIPIGGGICKRILDPVHGCAEKLAPENTPPSAMAGQDQIWRGRPRWGSLKTPHRYPKNHPPSHPQANFTPAPRFGCKKRSCVLRIEHPDGMLGNCVNSQMAHTLPTSHRLRPGIVASLL